MKKAIIKVTNTTSWLTTDCNEVRYILWKSLRFRVKNYYHSTLYKKKIWDGYNEFFHQISGKFLTGLLPEIESALKYLKVKYEIEDLRTSVKWKYTDIQKDFLQQWNPHFHNPYDIKVPNEFPKNFELFDYQYDIVNKIIKYNRGIIFAPTSAGKSAMMLCILKALHPKEPALMLANNKTLVDQFYNDAKLWGLNNLGRLYEKNKEPNMVTCATVQSLHKIEKVLPKIKVIIVDEVHTMMSKIPIKYYKKLKNACVRVGVSATPFKDGGKDKVQKYNVKGYFGPTIKTNSISADENGFLTAPSLQKQGQLSKADCHFWIITKPELKYEIYQDAVTYGIAENFELHYAVKELVSKSKGRTLILVERLNHGDALADILNAAWVKGEDNNETRKEIIRELQIAKGNKVAIATQGIFNAGVNVKVHNLINAAGGQAEHVIKQRFGRGLRVADDKNILTYHDFIFKNNDYLFDHSNKRIKILTKEKYPITIHEELDYKF